MRAPSCALAPTHVGQRGAVCRSVSARGAGDARSVLGAWLGLQQGLAWPQSFQVIPQSAVRSPLTSNRSDRRSISVSVFGTQYYSRYAEQGPMPEMCFVVLLIPARFAQIRQTAAVQPGRRDMDDKGRTEESRAYYRYKIHRRGSPETGDNVCGESVSNWFLGRAGGAGDPLRSACCWASRLPGFHCLGGFESFQCL